MTDNYQKFRQQASNSCLFSQFTNDNNNLAILLLHTLFDRGILCTPQIARTVFHKTSISDTINSETCSNCRPAI